ncbi:MAG: flippase-like domain-containing protein [Acidobacteria bacterium]|nr:flippase-like domain-containing protein [Acidobacteriota bacterium]
MRKIIKSILILLVGLGAAWWFVSRLDWQSVGSHLRNAKIWPLVAGAVLINLTILARSLRWQAFLNPIRKVGLGNIFAATSIGFGSLFVIGRAGEIVRPAILSLRERLRPSATIATILIERIYDTTMVVSLFAANLIFFDLSTTTLNDEKSVKSMRMFGLILLAGIVSGLALLLVLRLKSEKVIAWIERGSTILPRALVGPLVNLIRHLSDGLSVLLNLRELIVTILYTVLVWGLISMATWMTLYAFGLKFSPGQIIFILGIGLVGSVVPTPGGSAGAFHVAAAKGFEILGLETNLAASIAIIYHLIAFGPPFLMGLFFLIRDEISIHQIREMLASESEPHDTIDGHRASESESTISGGRQV